MAKKSVSKKSSKKVAKKKASAKKAAPKKVAKKAPVKKAAAKKAPKEAKPEASSQERALGLIAEGAALIGWKMVCPHADNHEAPIDYMILGTSERVNHIIDLIEDHEPNIDPSNVNFVEPSLEAKEIKSPDEQEDHEQIEPQKETIERDEDHEHGLEEEHESEDDDEDDDDQDGYF